MSMADMSPAEAGRGNFFLKQSANIYSMMLILSLLAIVIGCLFMFLEWKAYELHVTVPQPDKVPTTQWIPAEPHHMLASEAAPTNTDFSVQMV
ncbi:MAG TPA: hypothetical protein VGJ15_08250 [Pirellulales bacterium]|jgi:hypothetical protein